MNRNWFLIWIAVIGLAVFGFLFWESQSRYVGQLPIDIKGSLSDRPDELNVTRGPEYKQDNSGRKIIFFRKKKSNNCVAALPLPDPECTPGAVDVSKSEEFVCGRPVPEEKVNESVRSRILSEYGVSPDQGGNFEIDHYIPLGLGGSNNDANLWAEPVEPRPAYQEKNNLEDYLRKKVCVEHGMSLTEAQYAIGNNWQDEWVKAFTN